MRRLAILAALLALEAGCGADAELRADGSPPARSAPSATDERAPAPVTPAEPVQVATALTRQAVPAAACDPGEIRPLRTTAKAWAAVARHRTAVFARPGGRKLAAFQRLNANEFPTVFGVLAEVLDAHCRAAWYKVQLPLRPNGSVGFVPATDVELETVRTRIEIDLSDRRFDLYRDGRRILRTTIAIGASITPTPTGDYYVNQRFTVTRPGSPFGPAALGINAFSPVLKDWAQGGPIGIHGTNRPDLIGGAVSYGCLRLPNETMQWVFDRTTAGTPVRISA